MPSMTLRRSIYSSHRRQHRRYSCRIASSWWLRAAIVTARRDEGLRAEVLPTPSGPSPRYGHPQLYIATSSWSPQIVHLGPLRRWLSPNDHVFDGGSLDGRTQECPDHAVESSPDCSARSRRRDRGRRRQGLLASVTGRPGIGWTAPPLANWPTARVGRSVRRAPSPRRS